MQNSIFAKIVAGEAPCHKIYEDDKTLAFLDIYPLNTGHTLVIPKVNPTEFVWDLDPDTYQALMATSFKLAKHLRKLSPLPYVNMSVIGLDVPYAHVNLVPFAESADIRKSQPTEEPDHQALAELAKKLHLAND